MKSIRNVRSVVLYLGAATMADGERVKAQLLKDAPSTDIELRPGFPPDGLLGVNGPEGALICVLEPAAPH